ncbi:MULTISPECIES: polyprenyl diphosphate synthase [Halomonadaceae]|uniref:Ditrans,polycis-undecaprenyl-diphosphate synthase ((2E,6E)-farnesyl-diphosphate specific) n=1 Tax=Vreelandella halophila TaxID=86177 RepID=A0A9X5B4W8_9GAMM|nr:MULTISPECIES: polyprenyl diphosphate synthase [Halomonas]MYL25557.1 di-trans,poly-cis-decaprenylcistransferase [Halomonas utahensis]MYL74793.1 di-trans,poly-cis-decaprenylcistransferase [Halomonas sp. 22501_18_FS]
MSETDQETDMPPLAGCPRHVAVIMDGNNRWARARGQRGISGHRAGVKSVRAAIETCGKSGVEVLTLFAFSSENWRRPEEEVSALMTLFLRSLRKEVRRLRENGIRLSFIGNRERFSHTLQEHMARAEQETAHCDSMELVIAADYGGHWDVAQASRRIAQEVAAGRLSPDEVDENLLQRYISLGDRPMPDLLIRTGGEQRISNFLLWQFAYTEFYFSPLYWPDFQHTAMREALADFAGRQRRFGRTGEQVAEPVMPQRQYG